MRAVSAATIICTIFTCCASQPHHHRRLHVERRHPSPIVDVLSVPGPTVIVYELNGQQIPTAEVSQGIENGSLIFAQSEPLASVSSFVISTTLASTSPVPSASSFEPSTSNAPSGSNVPAPTSSSAQLFGQATATPETGDSGTTVSASFSSDSAHGLDAEFPDGQLDCSTFPSDYGAVSVNWLGLGGWTGIQLPRSFNGGFSDIETMTSSTCPGGVCCTDGSYCSYACPAGYQKSQWPSTQGATGQSVGGILCMNGKLHLTNPSLSKTLCMTGTAEVSVQVRNTMKASAAVCRTDYPGTEGETIPLDTQPGTTSNLTCPDGDNYYEWQGLKTSAQYYVNPAGISVENACQWGTSANPWGNFAPMNLGVGYSEGNAWLSIFQNLPTTDQKLDFTVELVGNNGGYENLVGRCRYQSGQYCSGDNYDDCTSNGNGCTVAVKSGTATFVFS